MCRVDSPWPSQLPSRCCSHGSCFSNVCTGCCSLGFVRCQVFRQHTLAPGSSCCLLLNPLPLASPFVHLHCLLYCVPVQLRRAPAYTMVSRKPLPTSSSAAELHTDVPLPPDLLKGATMSNISSAEQRLLGTDFPTKTRAPTFKFGTSMYCVCARMCTRPIFLP